MLVQLCPLTTMATGQKSSHLTGPQLSWGIDYSFALSLENMGNIHKVFSHNSKGLLKPIHGLQVKTARSTDP